MARSMKNVTAETQIDNATATATQNSDWGKYRFQACRSVLKRLHAQGYQLVMIAEDGTTVRNCGARDLNALTTTVNITASRYKDYRDEVLTEEAFAEKTDQSVGYFLADSEDLTSAL